MRIQSLLDQKNDFQRIADEAETTPDYLIQIAYGFSKASPQLAKKLEMATKGQTTRCELRADVFGDVQVKVA